jgi:hypothetical protein
VSDRVFVVDAKKALQGQGFNDAFNEDLATLFMDIRANPHLLAKILAKIYWYPSAHYMAMVASRDYLEISPFKEAIVQDMVTLFVQ